MIVHHLIPKWAEMIILLSLVACQPCPELACDLVVKGACVDLGDSEPDPQLTERLSWAVNAGLAYWGADLSVLEGRTLALRREPLDVCDDHMACADMECGTIYLGAVLGNCYEYALPHEIGHVVLGGDTEHADPRWRGEPADCYQGNSP